MEIEEQPLTFGSYLKAIRLERGIPLEEVYYHTRISVEQLLAIEQDAHDYLPAEVYVTGFLKAYATAIGADAEQAVQLYKHDLHIRADAVKDEVGKEGKLVGFSLRCGAGLLVVALIAAIFYSYLPQLRRMLTGQMNPGNPKVMQETAEQAETEKAAATSVTPDEKYSPFGSRVGSSSRSSNSDTNLAAGKRNSLTSKIDKRAVGIQKDKRLAEASAKGRYVLEVLAHEEAWLKIIIDDQNPEAFELQAGDHLELSAHTGYNILLGNAAGVDLWLNSRSVPIFGKSGQVVTLQLP
jgi:cytoskeletal protein RodZ